VSEVEDDRTRSEAKDGDGVNDWVIAVDKELWRRLTEDRDSAAQEALKAALHEVVLYDHILSFDDGEVAISIEDAVKWGVVDGVALDCRIYTLPLDPKMVKA
jgi:hypothetical protein